MYVLSVYYKKLVSAHNLNVILPVTSLVDCETMFSGEKQFE